MGKTSQHDKIIRATAAMLRRRGYAATGLSDIVAASGAPKGSLYHYFPEGKDQIAAAAVRYAGGKVAATLAELAERKSSPSEIIRAYGALLAGWMSRSGFEDGCPISTTLLETAAAKSEIADAGREAFAVWATALAAPLARDGVAADRARALARLAIMSLEGALILARVERSEAPILFAVEEMAAIFAREISQSERSSDRCRD